MARDDSFHFRPRPGRIRDGGARASPRSRSFLTQVMAAAAKANGGPLTPAQMRRERRRTGGRTRPKKGRCSRIGRGQAVADRLKHSAAQRGPRERTRRVVIKARIVRLRSGSQAADAQSVTWNVTGRRATASAVDSMAPRQRRRMARRSPSAGERTAISSGSSLLRRTASACRTCGRLPET
jgi:hypothetical protein